MCAHTCAVNMQHICSGQRTTCGSLLSPSAIWALGMESRSSALVTGTLATKPYCCFSFGEINQHHQGPAGCALCYGRCTHLAPRRRKWRGQGGAAWLPGGRFQVTVHTQVEATFNRHWTMEEPQCPCMMSQQVHGLGFFLYVWYLWGSCSFSGSVKLLVCLFLLFIHSFIIMC